MARAETPAEERFIVVYQFMWKSLGLSGVTLSVFARIYGFCRDGTSEFYESRAKTAEFLGTTARTVTRSVNELVSRGLVVQTGTRTSPSGNVTRSYRLGDAVHDMPSPPDEPSLPDEASDDGTLNPDGSSGAPVTARHPRGKGKAKT
jgi:hypothetical protein